MKPLQDDALTDGTCALVCPRAAAPVRRRIARKLNDWRTMVSVPCRNYMGAQARGTAATPERKIRR